MSTRVYSLGHGNRSWDDLLALLRWAGVEALVDVRRWPRSRRFPHFNREAILAAAGSARLDYHYLGDLLGGFRQQGYEAWTRSPRFLEGLEALEGLAVAKPTAFMCAERLPERCHRRFIARELERRGYDVTHLVAPGEDWEPVQRGLFD